MVRTDNVSITCNVCNPKYPTIFHITAKLKRSDEQPASSALVSQQTCAHTGTGKQHCVLSIVLVQVKAKSGNNILETYVLLDLGSSATFCTEHLMRKLNLNSTKTNIFFRSMGQENTLDTLILTQLEVSNLTGTTFSISPLTFILKRACLWPNTTLWLKKTSEGGLILNRSKLPILMLKWICWLAPTPQCFLNHGKLSTAVTMDPMSSRPYWGGLWTVHFRGDESDSGKSSCPTVTANSISIAIVEELLIAQHIQYFNEKPSDEVGMSREELRFLQIMEESIRLIENHYWTNLPIIPKTKSWGKCLTVEQVSKKHPWTINYYKDWI